MGIIVTSRIIITSRTIRIEQNLVQNRTHNKFNLTIGRKYERMSCGQNLPRKLEEPLKMAKDVAKTSNSVARLQSVVQNIETKYLGSAEEAVANMAMAILEATSFDEMFNENNVPQKLLDTDLVVEEIVFNRSSFQGAIPYFATYRGRTVEHGEPFLMNCSGWQPVLVAYKCLEENWLPRNLTFHKADKPTAAGFYPITVVPSEEAF